MINVLLTRSNLCNHKDAYILVRCNKTIMGHNAFQVAIKNCTLFTKFITIYYLSKCIDRPTKEDA